MCEPIPTSLGNSEQSSSLTSGTKGIYDCHKNPLNQPDIAGKSIYNPYQPTTQNHHPRDTSMALSEQLSKSFIQKDIIEL